MAISSGGSYFYGQPQEIDQLIQAIQQPFSSQQFKRQFEPAAAALQPKFQQQQQQLQDVFRGAGNMSSGIFGGAGANLKGQQSATLANLAGQIGGQIPGELTALLNALKLSQQTMMPEGPIGPTTMSPPQQPGGSNPYAGLIQQLLGGSGGMGGGGSGGGGMPMPGGGGMPSGGGQPSGGAQQAGGGGTGYWTYSPDGTVAQGAGGEIYVNGVYQGNTSDPNAGGGGSSPLEQAGWGATYFTPETNVSDPLYQSITNYGMGFPDYGYPDYSNIDLGGYDFSGGL